MADSYQYLSSADFLLFVVGHDNKHERQVEQRDGHATRHGKEQWLKWFCEAGGGSPDEARLEQTPYPFQPH